jgi:hypothetical protein
MLDDIEDLIERNNHVLEILKPHSAGRDTRSSMFLGQRSFCQQLLTRRASRATTMGP